MPSLNQHAYVAQVTFAVHSEPDGRYTLDCQSGPAKPDCTIVGLTGQQLQQLYDTIGFALLPTEIPAGYRAGHEANTLVAPDGTVLRQV